MPACPYCSSSDLTRDGHDQRGRVIRACRACGRHATSESTSLVAGHRFPRDIILPAVRYYLQLGAAAERIAGILADRGVDVSGRTILRWVQKLGPALFLSLDALQLVERDLVRVPPMGVPCTGGRSYVRARHIAAIITRLGQTLQNPTTVSGPDQTATGSSGAHANVEEPFHLLQSVGAALNGG